MSNNARRFGSTIRLSERTIRLAEVIAARHGMSVSELVEMLLVESLDRAQPVPAPPPARTAAVIDLDSRRGRQPSP